MRDYNYIYGFIRVSATYTRTRVHVVSLLYRSHVYGVCSLLRFSYRNIRKPNITHHLRVTLSYRLFCFTLSCIYGVYPGKVQGMTTPHTHAWHGTYVYIKVDRS